MIALFAGLFVHQESKHVIFNENYLHSEGEIK